MTTELKTQVLQTAEEVARRAADVIAECAESAIRARGRFLIATSGGSTPWRMLELLAERDLPWAAFHWFQVDERIAAPDDPERNLVHLRASLLDRVPIPCEQIHAMPVEDPDPATAALQYSADLERIAGSPPILDLVHLGLGADGHTASLVPSDPALDVIDTAAALTEPYRGYRRMTLTLPALEHARRILWVVTGPEKRQALARLLAGDRSIPAGRVPTRRALILADASAAPDAPPMR